MDVLTAFPVRKSGKQKQAFRDAVQAYARELSYETKIEKGNGAKNVIIGNPDTAKYLVTAHYDTCARMIVPNLITPCNFVTFILYQLLVTGLIFAVAIGLGVGVGVLTKDPGVAGSAGYAAVWALLILMMVGPANKHNANDNTSGVVTALEIARTMPEMYRDRVCFVLFDLEEVGLFGSAAYRSSHKKVTNSQIVLNLDCVGDGDEIVFFPTKKLKKNGEKMEKLRKICGTTGSKSIAIREKGFAIYPSDQANFPLGVGICALLRSRWAGLYLDKIHTHKDTVLDQTNVNILRAAITTLICNDAA